MIRFNTFRPTRYLRSKFVEGKYLLASEATDLELEILDVLRKLVQKTIGDVAVEDAWKVEKLSSTQLLIKPGEAWFKGLPFVFRSGNDALVSGATLSLGTAPVGVVITDDSSGLGKVLTFNYGASTPTNIYRITVVAQEELVTESTPRGGDPFLQNVNLTETTAQKIRLNFKINIVPDSLQSESAVPYRDENSTSAVITNFPSVGGYAAPNLVNQIVVNPVSSGNGELVSLNTLSGSETIDGRDLELVLRNDPDLPVAGSGRPIPIGINETPSFQNGKLIDSNGNIYHLNLVTQDVVADQVILRIDKELDQPNPEIIVGKPFTLVKRDVYVTDSNGQPKGKLCWDIAAVDWNTTNGLIHESKITDLRSSVSSVRDFEAFVNNRQNLKLTSNGGVFWSLGNQLVTFTDTIHLINPHGPDLSIAPMMAIPLVDGGSLAYELNLVSGGAIEKGQLAINILSAGATSTLDPVSLDQVKIGNTVRDMSGMVAEITDIDDVNNTITTSPALVFSGPASIFLDSFGPGKVPLTKEYYILGVRKGAKAYFAGMELEDQEIMQIGDGPSYQLLTFVGSVGDADSDPNYTSVTRVVQGSSLVAAISKLDYVIDHLYWKDPVVAYINLPSTDNQLGDVRLATSNRLVYTWTGTNWTEVGKWKNGFTNYNALVSSSFSNLDGDVRLAYDTSIPYRYEASSNTWKALPVLLTGAKLVGGGTWSWTAPNLTFTADAYVEIKSQGLANNTIQFSTQSPVVLSNDGDCAYVVPNGGAGSATPNLTVLVANSSSVPTNAVVIARRVGVDVVVGTGSLRLKSGQSSELYAQMSDQNLTFLGAANTADSTPPYTSNVRGVVDESLVARVSALTDSVADEQEDRSAYLRANDPVTWTGTQLQFTSDIVLEVVNTKSGTVKTATIALANSPIILADGESAWISINRTSASETVTVNYSSITPIPAQTQANKNVFIIARRQDALGAGYVHLPLHKQVLEPGQTVRLGASGSGEGGGNEILESLKNQLLDSYFNLVTPNIFKVDKDTKVDLLSSTGVYSLVDKTFTFSGPAQTLVSIDLLDPNEFLPTTDSLSEVEVSAYWRLTDLDNSATYQISRNNGIEWQTVTMSRVGTTDLYRGYHKFSTEAAVQSLVQVANASLTKLDNAGNSELSKSFSISSGTKVLVRDIIVPLTKTGSPAGNLFVAICADNAGNPGDVLVESLPVTMASLSTGNNTVALSDTYLAAGTYHIRLRTDEAYKASYNVTTTNLAVTGSSNYAIEGLELNLRLKIISSMASKLEGFGVFYNKSVPASVASGSLNIEAFEFAGALNTYEFTLTKFLPHPDLLKVYDVNTGQVYDYGAFSLSGNKVIFESGQFYNPGQTIKLRFVQMEGSAFDNSDVNALLLASNHLGSTDAGIDRSIAGRGIFLRRPDGTLREICIDDSDNIVVYSV